MDGGPPRTGIALSRSLPGFTVWLQDATPGQEPVAQSARQ